jgi:hypothetical protein
MPLDITHQRLHNQQLARTSFTHAADVVSWLGAVQAQDYAGAKWAVGLRVRRAADAEIERAANDGEILRTHVMRPTWHFVAPADIRWMQQLTSARVHARNAGPYRQLEIDAATLLKSRKIVERSLRGGTSLTRRDLASALESGGVPAPEGQRLAFILHALELDAVICSGPWEGAWATHALLEERVPAAKPKTRDEALFELARRYFTSHGPAQVQDFAWWSGLAVADCRSGIELARSELRFETIEGKTYWYGQLTRERKATESVAYLLPNYDEYGIAYRDRSAILSSPLGLAAFQSARTYPHFYVIDGQVRGMWRREMTSDGVVVHLRPFEALSDSQRRALHVSAERYASFLAVPVRIAD